MFEMKLLEHFHHCYKNKKCGATHTILATHAKSAINKQTQKSKQTNKKTSKHPNNQTNKQTFTKKLQENVYKKQWMSVPWAKKQQLNDSTYFVSTSSSESSPNWRVLVLRHDDYRKPFQTWSDSFPHMGQSPSPTISDNLVQVSVGWFKICGIHLKLSSSSSVLSSFSYWNSSIASGLWFNIEQW